MPAIIIPTFNEEQGVGKVIDDFKKQGYTDIYVVDGFSTDRTVAIAKKHGARVLIRDRVGKGDAIRKAFTEIDADIYILIDGDNTYDPAEAKKLTRPVKDGAADMVIGRRSSSNMTSLNRLGNRMFNAFIKFGYGQRLADSQSGYRALSRRLVKSLNIIHDDFEIETDMTLGALENKFRVIEVPVKYRQRKGRTKLHPVRDGWKIGMAIMRFIRDYKPLKFFWTLSLLSFLVGLAFGIRVLLSFLQTGRLNFIGSAILAGVLMVLAIEFFISGLMADMINNRLKRIPSNR